MIVQTEGIVIRSMNYQEKDVIIKVLTPDIGKISLLVNGAKNSKNRNHAASQLLTKAQYTIYKKNNKPDTMGNLNNAEILDRHTSIKEDLLLATYAMFMIDLIDKNVEDGELVQKIYNLINSALMLLNNKQKDAGLILRIFEMKIFMLRGYQPILNNCAHCNTIDDTWNYKFSVLVGGFLCSKCFCVDGQALVISSKTAKILNIIQNIDLQQLGESKIMQSTRRELQIVNQAFIRNNLNISNKWFQHIQDIEQIENSNK